MRTFDIEKLIKDEYHDVKLKNSFDGRDSDFTESMIDVQTWADLRCKGDYILLLNSILCEHESDALLFKLKYG